MKKVIACVLLALAVACSGKKSTATETPSGSLVAVVKALTSTVNVTRINVSVSPSGNAVDLALDTSNGTFAGVINSVTPGAQTVTATAYAGSQAVGTGSANVTVEAGKVASAYIQILDTTGAAPGPDHGPIITSVVASPVTPDAGSSVSLTAAAIDPDGDPISLTWSQSCGTGGTLGTFTATTGAETSWSNGAPGQCRLTVTATSRALSDSLGVKVTVFPTGGQAGAVEVSGVFVEWPYITRVEFSSASSYTTVNRTGDGTVRMQVGPGRRYWINADAACSGNGCGSGDGGGTSSATWAVTDNCGGVSSSNGSADEYASFEWTAPPTNGLCMITVSKTVSGMTDRFPVAVFLSGCADDVYESNDSYSQSAGLSVPVSGGTLAVSGLYANDDDWYYAPMGGITAGTNLTFVLDTTAQLTVEIVAVTSSPQPPYTPTVTVVASGTNTVSAVVPPATGYTSYYIHVVPPALAAGTCGPAYGLAIGGVYVYPQDANLFVGGQQPFYASNGGASQPTYTWSVIGADCGSITTSDGNAVYTAPPAVPAGACQVAASYTDDAGTFTGFANVTINPAPTVTVTPAIASLALGATQQFTASVSGVSTPYVSWSVSPADCGFIMGDMATPTATYTAPSNAPSGSCQVIAHYWYGNMLDSQGSVTFTVP